MNISDFHDQMISVTQLRRGVDSLKIILSKYGVAWVMRNQDVMFVAVEPEKYAELKENEKRNIDRNKLKKAIETIDRVRDAHGEVYGTPATDSLIKARDERRKKWQRK